MGAYNGRMIDCHLHLHGHPGDTALLDRLPAMAQSGHLERINCLSCTGEAVTLEDECAQENLVLAQAKLKHPGLLYIFGGLYHCLPKGGPDLAAQVKMLAALGYDGIKMIEGKPTVYKKAPYPLDDAVYNPFYAYCEATGFPILFHVADPEEFWDPDKVPDWAKQFNWLYDASFPAKEELYRQVGSILKRFPGLKIIFAHFYFLSADPARAAAFFDQWPNVSFDLTPGSEMYFNFSKKRDQWREFFINYQDRILFGTDNTDTYKTEDCVGNIGFIRRFLETDEQFTAWWGGNLHGMALPPDVLEKIHHRNFIRYAGDKPKKINRELALGAGRAVLDPGQKMDLAQVLG